MNEAVVSVLMSVYNTDEVFLREAIESVLAQTFGAFEFLIADDCSDEETKQILEEYRLKDGRVRIITNAENKGLTKNLNRLIREAKGKYLARMDADDVCFPERFMKQTAFLDRHPDIAVVGAWFNIIKDRRIIGYKKEAFLPYQMKARLFFQNIGNLHSSMMMRRDVFNQENGLLYDESMKKTQDYDLWARASQNHKMYLLPEVLMSYRVSEGQISTAGAASQSAFRDKVILSQLENLVDSPTPEAKQIHLGYCTGQNAFPAKTYMQWGNRIIQSNHQRRCYDPRAFDYYAYTLMIRGVLRSADKKPPVSFIAALFRFAYVLARFYLSWGWDALTGRF